jgi:hypothetical protein
MGRKKKIEIAPEVVEEAIAEVVTEIKREDRAAELQARIDYLRGIRQDLVNEGVDSIGKLDVIIGKVIQEQNAL